MQTSEARRLGPALVALLLLATGCRDQMPSEPELITGPSADLLSLPSGEEDGDAANFRLTGGGRIDGHNHESGSEARKSLPGSHDFATFGWEARPTAPDATSGSGHITWVEHNSDATIYGAFTFHGEVTHFSRSTDEDTQDDPDCGRFRGEGVVRTRALVTFPAKFIVKHACDKGEPGRQDHIKMKIEITARSAEFMSEDNDGNYERHGLLTGGNVQKHGI